MSAVVGRVTERPVLLAWLTLVWVGLWGSATAANVLGGLLVAAVLLLGLPVPASTRRGRVRPSALLRFVAAFGYDLVRASLEVIALIVRPRTALRQGVVAVRVVGESDALLTVLANAISLTPGTLTLEVDRATSTLYVHVLHIREGPDAVDRIRRDILGLEQLAMRALSAPRPGGAR